MVAVTVVVMVVLVTVVCVVVVVTVVIVVMVEVVVVMVVKVVVVVVVVTVVMLVAVTVVVTLVMVEVVIVVVVVVMLVIVVVVVVVVGTGSIGLKSTLPLHGTTKNRPHVTCPSKSLYMTGSFNEDGKVNSRSFLCMVTERHLITGGENVRILLLIIFPEHHDSLISVGFSFVQASLYNM